MTDYAEPTTVQPRYHLDRASARTNAEREEHWLHWWTTFGEPHQAAVIERGGTPWTADLDERKGLWFRRYERPEPPASIPVRTLAEIRGDAARWSPVTPTTEESTAA